MPGTALIWGASSGPVRLGPVLKAVLDVRARQALRATAIYLYQCSEHGSILPQTEFDLQVHAAVFRTNRPLGRKIAQREWKPAGKPPLVALKDGPEILVEPDMNLILQWHLLPGGPGYEGKSNGPYDGIVIPGGARLAIVAESSRPCWAVAAMTGD